MEKQDGVSIELPNMETITSRRHYIPGLFGITILFFFFSFCELSCQGQRFAKISGINLVTGTQIEGPQSNNSFGLGAPSQEESQKMPGNIWALIALLAAAGGLTIFLIRHKNENMAGAIAGATGAVALLVLQITLSDSIKLEGRGMITISFLFPYWASLLALAGAGTLCFLRFKKVSLDSVQPDFQAAHVAHSGMSSTYGTQTNKEEAPPQSFVPPYISKDASLSRQESETVSPPQQIIEPEMTSPSAPLQKELETDSPVIHSTATRTYSTPLPEQHQFNPVYKTENIPPAIQVKAKQDGYYSPKNDSQNWLVWLIIAAVSIVIIATIVIEVL